MSLADDIRNILQGDPYYDRAVQIREENIQESRVQEASVATLRATVAKILEAQMEILTTISRLAGVVERQKATIEEQAEHIDQLTTDTGLLMVRGQRVDAAFDALLSRVEALHADDGKKERAIDSLTRRIARFEDGFRPTYKPLEGS